jgi:hypothetical protein
MKRNFLSRIDAQNKGELREDRIVFGGLGSACLAGILTIVNAKIDSWAGLAALICFGIAVPTTAMAFLFVARLEWSDQNKRLIDFKLLLIPVVLGVLGGIGGFFFMICTLSATAACAFLLAAIVCLTVSTICDRTIERASASQEHTATQQMAAGDKSISDGKAA